MINTGLRKEQSRKIETVQKKAFTLILGKNYTNYEFAFIDLKQD